MTPKRTPNNRNQPNTQWLPLALLMSLLFLPISAQASPWLAQAASPNLPSAGSVLGWELNMNQRYTRQLDPRVPTSENAPNPEAPVIFYDLKYWQNDALMKDLPYLHNTPDPK